MRIALCLKAVWRTDVKVRLDEAGRAPRAEGAPILDPASSAALALALDLVRQAPAQAASVLAVTVGPTAWEALLRDALAWGAALPPGTLRVLRLWPDAPDGEPGAPQSWEGSAEFTAAKAQAVAAALRGGSSIAPYDLVLAGDASQDSGQGCFGALLAQALGTGFAHRVVQAAPRGAPSGAGWSVRVKLERGYTQDLDLPGPAVLTVPASAAGPALPDPPLPQWLASRTAPVPWAACRLAPSRARTALRPPLPRVRHIERPAATLNAEQRIQAMMSVPAQQGGMQVAAAEGAGPQAEAAYRLLREKGFVK